jgi:protein-tyrosine-phosphatase/DNA-binding transcriptional ArsR family regulator
LTGGDLRCYHTVMKNNPAVRNDINPSSQSPHTAALQSLEALRLLTDETRWRLLQALRTSDRLVGELVEITGLAQNLVSYHLGVLRQAGLVQIHKSDVDARATYYGIDLAAVSALYQRLGADLAVPSALPAGELPARTVVFLCRANSARSQIAEGWLRSLSGGRITVRSAGTQPARLHPLAEQVMAEVGIDIGHHQSKHVDALAGLAPEVVVTVCDIAREECAVWQQAVTRLHWSIPDPVMVPAGDGQLEAFRKVRDALGQRVEGLLAIVDPRIWFWRSLRDDVMPHGAPVGAADQTWRGHTSGA